MLKSKRILAGIGIVALILGIILPYYQVTIFNHTYKIALWRYIEGKIAMMLTMANLLFIFKDVIEKYAPQMFESSLGKKIKTTNSKFAIVPTILIIAFVVILFLRLDVGSSLTHGPGFFLLWCGIICLISHTLLYKKNNQNE